MTMTTRREAEWGCSVAAAAARLAGDDDDGGADNDQQPDQPGNGRSRVHWLTSGLRWNQPPVRTRRPRSTSLSIYQTAGRPALRGSVAAASEPPAAGPPSTSSIAWAWPRRPLNSAVGRTGW